MNDRFTDALDLLASPNLEPVDWMMVEPSSLRLPADRVDMEVPFHCPCGEMFKVYTQVVDSQSVGAVHVFFTVDAEDVAAHADHRNLDGKP